MPVDTDGKTTGWSKRRNPVAAGMMKPAVCFTRQSETYASVGSICRGVINFDEEQHSNGREIKRRGPSISGYNALRPAPGYPSRRLVYLR